MVIKVDKSEEFKKSGKKLISEYEGAKWKEELLWDENESNKRMDVIGQNGNTGLHYLENPRPEEEIADYLAE